MKVFFLGGSFDPPHKGHKFIAENCIKNNLCDKFLFIPSKKNPFKPNPFFSAESRLAMLKEIASSINKNYYKKVEVDSFEIHSNQESSFTINTVNHLVAKYPRDEIFMVFGIDLVKDLDRWKKWEEIKNLVKLVCINRPSYEFNSSIRLDIMIENNNYNIDSTSIRKKIAIKNFSNLSDQVPNEILKYLTNKNSNS